MRLLDLIRFTLLTLVRQRFRSFMLILSLALGVASTTLLVSLGEAARSYVLGEFAFLGSDVLAIFPGRKTTTGAMPPVTGTAARDITLQDAVVLERSVPGVVGVAALVAGNAPVSFQSRERGGMVLGVSEDFFPIRRLTVGRGQVWQGIPLDVSAPVAVIGDTVRQELFGNRGALGEWIRVRNFRFRVVGILEGSADSFGSDLSEAVFIPVASAQQLFNVSGLFRLVVRVDERFDRDEMVRRIEAKMTELHDGELDVTVVNPDAMVASISDILRVMTLAVAGIAAISLLVAGVLVMNLTLISVQQRITEIGLMKAIGATSTQIRLLFVFEAALLGVGGIISGVLISALTLLAAARVVPELSWGLPWWALLAVSLVTLLTATVFAWRPAGKAAGLNPIAALGRG